jgi:UDP-2-acetamido-3-amino-2,3-dideoxy-glucuronate N-acetyltransferase
MSKTIHTDERGNLGVFEFKDLPFKPARFFWIFGTPIDKGRAGHAHKECSQFIFSQQGTIEISVLAPNGEITRRSLSPGDVLHLPPLHWLELINFSSESVLGVFASHAYDRGEYVDSKEEFLALTAN